MIKIVRGVYGFKDENGIVRPKTAADEPFELLAEQEERLVSLGVAEYAGNIEDKQDPIGFDEIPPEDFAEDVEDETEVVEGPIDLETLTVNELRELGKEYGLTFKTNTKKADMIEAITEAQYDVAEDDGELAPVFDATEAVQ